MTGDEIEKISDESLYKKLKTTKIFARMTPKQKLRLLRTLSSNGEVVAMTGDGVNDVPTLHHAAIGIALGSGTDIAKDASDLILINNSFFVIVSAIQEGRRIISNLKRVLVYLISTSFSEIWLIGLSFIMGLPVPLLPSHILWANVVEESFISVAFAFEKKDVEQVKKWKTKNIFSKDVKKLIVIISITTGLLLTAIYVFLLSLNMTIEEVRSIMFLALSIDSLFFALSLKNMMKPIWKINIFDNKYLLLAILFSAVILGSAFSIETLRTILSISIPDFTIILWVLLFGSLNLVIIEISKYFVFRKRRV